MDAGTTIVARPVVETISQSGATIQKSDSLHHGTKTEGDMPLEIYEQENKSKYINDLLQVDDMLPEYLRESIGTIDEYVEGLMSKRGYNRTTEAYKATLDRLQKDLGVDENTSLEETVERMGKYIEAEGILKSLKAVDEAEILKQLRKSPTRQLIDLVMAQIEKRGLDV